MKSLANLMRAIADNPYVDTDVRERARHLLFMHHGPLWRMMF